MPRAHCWPGSYDRSSISVSCVITSLRDRASVRSTGDLGSAVHCLDSASNCSQCSCHKNRSAPAGQAKAEMLLTSERDRPTSRMSSDSAFVANASTLIYPNYTSPGLSVLKLPRYEYALRQELDRRRFSHLVAESELIAADIVGLSALQQAFTRSRLDILPIRSPWTVSNTHLEMRCYSPHKVAELRSGSKDDYYAAIRESCRTSLGHATNTLLLCAQGPSL